MTRQHAIQALAYIEGECRRVRESLEGGSNTYITEKPDDDTWRGVETHSLCSASVHMDSVYAGPITEGGEE